MMSYIAAPWREAYVRTLCRAMKECIFCRAARARSDAGSYVLYRGRHNFILLNKFPYTPGHLMIAPYRHAAAYESASKPATDEMADLLKLSVRILRRLYRPHGFNTGMNLGQSAGAGVADHYHLHVICRWTGDANFMPLVGKTRVLVEDLGHTYDRLVPHFRKERPRPRRGRGA